MSNFGPESSWYPQAAGNSFPSLFKIPGSSFAGNIIPDSMMDGKNISWEIIVSFAWFFTDSPKTPATLKDTAINAVSVVKYNGRSDGIFASKAIGAVIRMIALMISRWTKAEKASETSPKYIGTPFARYIFFISVP